MRISIAFVLLVALSAPVYAVEAPARDSGAAAREREAQPRVCHDDIQKYCGQVKPGGGRLARCMKENDKSLSPACKAEMEKKHKQATEKREELHEACKADADKFCKDKLDGRGGAMRCLHAHDKELSEACRKTLPKRPARGERRDRGEGEKPAR
jgi:hypothetical protein